MNTNLWLHSTTMYIAEAKCLMSHQYPNGPPPNVREEGVCGNGRGRQTNV